MLTTSRFPREYVYEEGVTETAELYRSGRGFRSAPRRSAVASANCDGSLELIVAVDVERALLAELLFEAAALPAPDRVALDLGPKLLL